MVEILEIIDLPQSTRDRVLWELSSRGKMKKRDLRRYSGLRLSELEPVLEELVKEGKIWISTSEIVSIK
jgi:hypothetical protein